MGCSNKKENIKDKIVFRLHLIVLRWRMIYGPLIKHGKFKEAHEKWKERRKR